MKVKRRISELSYVTFEQVLSFLLGAQIASSLFAPDLLKETLASFDRFLCFNY